MHNGNLNVNLFHKNKRTVFHGKAIERNRKTLI